MKTLITLAGLTGVAALLMSTNTVAGDYYLSPSVERNLVKVCKYSAQDKLYKMKSVMREFNWSDKLIALNVVCNGQDIISFSDSYGAVRTTARLSNSLGSVQVTDIASTNNSYDVTFTFNAN